MEIVRHRFGTAGAIKEMRAALASAGVAPEIR
jgi:hypothetical protein